MNMDINRPFIEEKRRILIVEDEPINQMMLENVLKGSYEVLMASCGKEALTLIYDYKERLSMVLLDLILPDMNGMDILKQLGEDGILLSLPVIVLTSDRKAEVDSLNLGAVDFITKPYPAPEVILARIKRTIELIEGSGRVQIDPLTGLYIREPFFLMAENYDFHHKDEPLDAIVVNINHFHMINERYGKSYGDDVLARIGKNAQKVAADLDGMACRSQGDTFLIYGKHSNDYTGILQTLSAGISGERNEDRVIRLRMGVYSDVDKSLDIERRFDRAKLAADTVRSTFTQAVAIYDNALHESVIFAEQLLSDFPRAIEDKEFIVYYQPKYDIRGSQPVLHSAEALIRWDHPEFGMISPGIFIPLFEKHGLIRQLDAFVWKAAARQMREWHERFGFSVPVSVNVSRVDMYDPHLVEFFDSIVDQYELNQNEFMLEITESAYTEDSEMIIDTANALRKAGFFLEMDDFGSGYSSLNMLSNLPVDALKLDMQFIRSAFKNGKNIRLLELVIDIAASLSVPVVAEGVETAEQLFTLKSMGCDFVQGYYFSKPVPPDKFEDLLVERKTESSTGVVTKRRGRTIAHDKHTYNAMHDPLTGIYNNTAFDIFYYDADQKHTALFFADIKGYEKYNQITKDKAAIKVAKALKSNFRATDKVFRIRDDEFAVLLSRISWAQEEVIYDKILQINEGLKVATDTTPSVSIIVGLAFGDKENGSGDLFQDADEALEEAKATNQVCVEYA